MSRKKIIIAFIVVTLIVGLALLFKSRGGAVKVRPVEMESVVVAKNISASGIVTSLYESDLSLAAIGVVNSISVKEGDIVKKGDLLLSLSNYASYQDSQSALQAKNSAQKDLEIYIENYSDNVDAAGGEDEYYLNIEKLRTAISRAEANYQSALGTLSNSVLRAPNDGTVVEIYKETGEIAASTTPLVKLADLNNLVFEINLDQEDFGFVKKDQQVVITLDSYDGKEYKGKVVDLPFYADSTTDEFKVKIALTNADSAVLLGMTGDANIMIESTKSKVNALIFDEILEEDGKHFVWVNDSGVAKKKFIETGLEGDLYTEVKSADVSNIITPVDSETELKEGDKISVSQ